MDLAPTRPRLAALTAVLTLGPVAALVPSAASQGAPALLPDLVQDVPRDVGAGHAHAPDGSLTSGWAISFDSAVRNVGPGPLHLVGRRTAGGMEVAQVLHGGRAEASVAVGGVPRVGRMRYVTSYGHRHWHVLGFERYALRSLGRPGRVVRDTKQGFCLSNGYADGWCSRDRAGARTVAMGLLPDPTYADVYRARVEGQEIPVSRASAPSGRYDLVHTVDPGGRLREADATNGSSSVEVRLTWPAARDRAPRVRVLRRCPGSATCGARAPG
jgi:hypothetical protein